MPTRDTPPTAPASGHPFGPQTTPGRRALQALGAGAVLLVAATAVLNAAGQGLAATLLGAGAGVLALACLVLGIHAVLRHGERSALVVGAVVIAGLVLAVLLHPLLISD